MGDLTANLSRHEGACKCGCGFDTMDYETVEIVQEVCNHFDCSVTINSWCRCLDHNRSIGSKDTSQHVLGKAADCVFRGPSIDEVASYLKFNYPDHLGIGVYEDFIHIDSRKDKARW